METIQAKEEEKRIQAIINEKEKVTTANQSMVQLQKVSQCIFVLYCFGAQLLGQYCGIKLIEKKCFHVIFMIQVSIQPDPII